MALFGFGKKKEEEKKASAITQQVSQMPEIPNLPEFPSLDEEEFSDFPKYEPTLADIKKEITKGDEEFTVPVRDQSLSGKKMTNFSQSETNAPAFVPETPARQSIGMGEKPLFVKIDNYKQAMHTLDALKAKLDDAEEVLRAFEDVKAQEDEKLEAWKRDIQNMKDKLFSIDKELFEV